MTIEHDTTARLFELFQELSRQRRAEVEHLIETLAHATELADGGPELTHTAVGRLMFHTMRHRPIHHMTVELWDRQFIHPHEVLGRAITDEEGYFAIRFSPQHARTRDELHLDLRVIEYSYTYSSAGDLIPHAAMVYHEEHPEPVTSELLDFGTISFPFWEYRPGELPRVMVLPVGDPPQEYALGRKVAVEKALAEVILKRETHRVAHLIDPARPSIEQIQDDYPESLTVQLERERPGYSRSDEYLGERVLSGFYPLSLCPDRDHTDWYRYHCNWDCCEMNGVYDLPNVDIAFELRDDRLYPIQITLCFRQPGGLAPYSPMQDPVTYTPDDGDLWIQAKRVFRMVWGVAGEVDMHLAQTHINTEQFAIAAWRNLRLNPVRYLLFPHLKEVVTINCAGDRVITGPEGILPQATGLTSRAIPVRFAEQLASKDWAGWRPRAPMTSKDTFALAGQIYWEILSHHIEEFFRRNYEEIVGQWFEIHRFSRDLVEHSVPYSPPHQVPAEDWSNNSEHDNSAVPRRKINGFLRAIRPITVAAVPGEQDILNLQEVCRYIIFQATYVHSYTNEQQYDDGGEILYLSMGMRNGSMGLESDLSVAPLPLHASEQLFIGRFLSKTIYGTIVKNEDGDIPPNLVQMVRERRADFAAVGYNVDKLMSRVNI